MQQMNFIGDLKQKVVEFISEYTTTTAADSTTTQSGRRELSKVGGVKAPRLRSFSSIDECKNVGFKKMKYISSKQFE